jgi:hypothetical protein
MKRKYVRRGATSGAATVRASLMLAPAVMAFRLPIFASEATAANPWRAETIKAVTEKAAAAIEGVAAAQIAIARSMWSFWPEAMSGKVPSLVSGKAARLAADAAMKPAGRRVRANFRRLSAKSGS